MENNIANTTELQNDPEVNSAKRSKWFKGVDSLRFILALIVVLGHATNVPADLLQKSHTSVLRYFGNILSLSFIGPAAVIAFFVISGFVIHYPNKNGIKNLKQYYIRRYVRVVIPLVIILILGTFIGNPETGVVWSLYCELIYYTIYPFLLKWKLSWNYKLVISAVVCILCVTFLAQHDLQSAIHQKNISFHGGYIQLGNALTWLVGLPCWLTGVKLAEIIDKSNFSISFARLLLYRLSVYAIVACLAFSRFHLFISYILSLNILCFPLFFWLRAEIVYYKTHQPIKPIEESGKFSYSIYLCHPLLLTLLPSLIALNIYTYFVYIALILFMSWLFYQAIEKQSHLLAQKLGKRQVVSAIT